MIKIFRLKIGQLIHCKCVISIWIQRKCTAVQCTSNFIRTHVLSDIHRCMCTLKWETNVPERQSTVPGDVHLYKAANVLYCAPVKPVRLNCIVLQCTCTCLKKAHIS